MVAGEAVAAIQSIVDFARDNENVITDSVIDSFFKEKLNDKDKKAIRAYLSQNGIEILIEKTNTVKLSAKDIQDDQDLFDQPVACGRDGSVDGFKQFMRIVRKYPLLKAEEEIRYSISWHTADAASRIMNIMKEKSAAAADEEMIREAFPKKNSKEDFTDYYLPLVGKDMASLQDIFESGKKDRELLINCNIRLSVACAKKASARRPSDFEDLCQAGIEGLMHACDKYDYRKGFRFSTYATFWVRQYQTRLKNDQSRVIRIPAYVYDKIAKIKSTQAELLKKLGRDPEPEEVAAAMNMTLAKLMEIEQNSKDVLSIDYIVDSEDDSDISPMEEFIATDKKESPEYIAENKALEHAISQSLSELPDKEAEVITLRYGLFGNKVSTLDEISTAFGVSKERVRQIETRGLKQLKAPVHKKRLREYTDFAV